MLGFSEDMVLASTSTLENFAKYLLSFYDMDSFFWVEITKTFIFWTRQVVTTTLRWTQTSDHRQIAL